MGQVCDSLRSICDELTGGGQSQQRSLGNQPAHGQPAYGQPAYGQPAYGQPAYGQPAYGQAYAHNIYGQQPSVEMGQMAASSAQPAYGQPAYGQAYAQRSSQPMMAQPVMAAASAQPSWEQSAQPMMAQPIIPGQSAQPMMAQPIIPGQSAQPMMAQPIIPGQSVPHMMAQSTGSQFQTRDAFGMNQGMQPAVATAVPMVGAYGMQSQATDFQTQPVAAQQLLTQLQGTRKSLLIGINYFNTDSELSGCINDVQRMVPFLQTMGFPSDQQSQVILTDDPRTPYHQRPTLDNMKRAMSWLVAGAQAGDVLFFHYSGHGGREPSSNSSDGYHETLCPVDMDDAGQLLDTEMFEILVRPLPSGCRLTCLLDCCHSGGVLNLPYLFVGTTENLKAAFAGQVKQMAMSKNWANNLAMAQHGHYEYLLMDVASMGLGIWDLYKKKEDAAKAGQEGFMAQESQNAGLSVGEVIAFTGCRSDQTSADVGDVSEAFDLRPAGRHGGSMILDQRRMGRPGESGGALTSVFIETIQAHAQGQLTYLSLLDIIRSRLEEERFTQVPQLCSSMIIELQQQFSLTTAFIPPDPQSRAKGAGMGMGGGMGGGGGGGMGMERGMGGGGEMALGSAAAAGFLASLAFQPQGGGLLRRARGSSSDIAPYENFSGECGQLPGSWSEAYPGDFNSMGFGMMANAFANPDGFGGHDRGIGGMIAGAFGVQDETFHSHSSGEDYESTSAQDDDDDESPSNQWG